MSTRYSSCAFTGHRLIPKQLFDRIREVLYFEILAAYECGVRDYYCGGALGFDTMAASAVASFKLEYPDARLNLILPCKDQDKSWSEADRLIYRELISKADYVEYISEVYTDGCMRWRNKRLADLCDLLIAYCERDRSGAAQTIRFATLGGKRVINIADWLSYG